MKPKLTQKLFALIIATGFFTTGFAQTTTPLDDYILDKMKEKSNTPGLAFSLIKNGKVALTKGYGYADIGKDNPFTPNIIMSEIASVSKTVTATAIMKLWEEELFQLDDPINNYLPFEVKNPWYPNTPITFRMLLCHTSSICSDESVNVDTNFKYVRPPGTGMSLESFIKNRLVPGGSLYNFQTASFDNNPPGVRYHYSNTGYGLLGYLVERISGMPFDEYCKQKIFQPLCMNQTTWFYSGVDTNIIARPYRDYNGNPQTQATALYDHLDYPSYQLKTTVIDFSKYMQMHMNFGIHNGVRIIDSTTEVMMRTPQVNIITGGVVIHDGVPIVINNDECLGFNKITHTSEGNKVFIGHMGGDIGVTTVFWINTSNNTGEMIFANSLKVEEQMVDIHLFLEQSVADTITVSGLPDLDCSYSFNPCEHNTDYWIAHTNDWALSTVPMKLGTKHYYSKNQTLDLLNRPVNGDASISLAKSLITAKLNIAQGSVLSPIVLTYNAAMNLIGDKRIPYDNPVPFSSATGIQMLALAATLDSYNAGNLNTTACSDDPSSVTRSNPVNEIDKVTTQYSLSVFPNPSSGNTTISISLMQKEKVSIKVFDMSGRLVKTLTDKIFEKGEHLVNWNTENANAGIYLVKMEAKNFSGTKKLVVMK